MTQINLNDTIRKDGLFACFRPKLPKNLPRLPKLKKSSEKFEETADFEFEIRRFSGDDNESEDRVSWRREVRKSWVDFDQFRQQSKDQSSETLENLRLQSQVYREEVNSLKRQIDELKQEKRNLAENILPKTARYLL